MKEINIALIDSGTSLDCIEKVSIFVENGKIEIKPQNDISLKHGDEIGKLIDTKYTKLYDIQVFQENLNTSPLHIYGALEYLLDKDIDVISMSLGFTTNYKEIQDICQRLLDKGVSIIASYPRSGGDKIYPASYEGVVRVTADGKCEELDISIIEDDLFGANPHSSIEGISGSSIAVGKFTKVYTKYLSKGYKKEQILKRLKDEAK